MARRDLANEEIEAMSLEEPGSAAEYLRLRREELARNSRPRARRTIRSALLSSLWLPEAIEPMHLPSGRSS